MVFEHLPWDLGTTKGKGNEEYARDAEPTFSQRLTSPETSPSLPQVCRREKRGRPVGSAEVLTFSGGFSFHTSLRFLDHGTIFRGVESWMESEEEPESRV